MKKRIPVFSAFTFLYVILELLRVIKNMSAVFYGLDVLKGSPVTLTSFVPVFLQLALVVALAVMAVMLPGKPQLATPAGYLALGWAIWSGFSVVRSLISVVASGQDAVALVRTVCAAIPDAVVLVVWVMASIALVSGKEVKDVSVSFTKVVILGGVLALVCALPAMFDGNGNVAGLMISGIVDALPAIAMLAAGKLLHGAFAAPDKTPILTGDLVKKTVIGVVLVAISLAVFYACETPKDDGKDYGICGNCGTRIETKYIYSGGCWRCNGNDWSK